VLDVGAIESQRKFTRKERDEMGVVIRGRERRAYMEIDARAAKVLSDFEKELDAKYYPGDDETWAEAYERGRQVEREIKAIIAPISKKKNIRPEFAPDYDAYWSRRGENESKERRAELKRLAVAEIDAQRKALRASVASAALEARTQLMLDGDLSDAVKDWIRSLPPVDDVLRPLKLTVMEQKLGLPEK
jgi:hypothetical protein